MSCPLLKFELPVLLKFELSVTVVLGTDFFVIYSQLDSVKLFILICHV